MANYRPEAARRKFSSLTGYSFRVVALLLTNFHLPKSTLLMLVCVFGGMEQMMAAYRHAVEKWKKEVSFLQVMAMRC